jgi:trk system potassium uptake protein TrkA
MCSVRGAEAGYLDSMVSAGTSHALREIRHPDGLGGMEPGPESAQTDRHGGGPGTAEDRIHREGDASFNRSLRDVGPVGRDGPCLAEVFLHLLEFFFGDFTARRFRVPRTLALVNDPDNEEIFKELSNTIAFSTTHILANLIEQRASFEEITNLLPVGEGKINVTEVALTEDAPAVGKSLMDISLPENALIAGILREGEAIIPRGSTALHAGDRLILMTLPADHGRILKLLLGESAQ